MIYTHLFAKDRFQPHEQWIKDNLLYECIMGSQAYGLNRPDSDIDIVALVMPKHEHLYPQHYGYILGFDQIPNFEHKDVKGEKNRIPLLQISKHSDVEGEWNSLVRFFYLAGLKGSPNLIEILFVRKNLVTFSHKIGWMLRDNAQKFLSIRTFNSFKGYAFQQLERTRKDVQRGKTENPKRQHYLDTFGYDIKQSYHPLRLLDQINQLLDEGTIDLMRNKDECKIMRDGKWGSWDKFYNHIHDQLRLIEEKALKQNAISPKPRLGELKQLLADCIEEWYGNELNMQKSSTEYVSVKQLWDRLDRIEQKLDIDPSLRFNDWD